MSSEQITNEQIAADERRANRLYIDLITTQPCGVMLFLQSYFDRIMLRHITVKEYAEAVEYAKKFQREHPAAAQLADLERAVVEAAVALIQMNKPVIPATGYYHAYNDLKEAVLALIAAREQATAQMEERP